MQFIDVFAHIVPDRFLERVQLLYPDAYPRGLLRDRPSLHILEERLRVIDAFPGYAQVLTLAQPPLDGLGDGSHAVELARLANDAMAEAVADHRDHFVGFAAALPNNDPEAAGRELERAVHELGALGVQIHTDVRGVSWDDARFEWFFRRMESLERPIWVHPSTVVTSASADGPRRSDYGFDVALGWPYATAEFMLRLVFSGLIERYPRLRIITHHGGGMISHFEGRIGKGVVKLHGSWPLDPDAITARAATQLKSFYGDTALNGIGHSVECAFQFFGAERLLFGTDMPFDNNNGVSYVGDTIRNVQELDVSEAMRSRIAYGNARELLGMGART